MKQIIPKFYTAKIAAATVLWAGLACAQPNESPPAAPEPPTAPVAPVAPVAPIAPVAPNIVINTIEPGSRMNHAKEVAWLGLAVEEAPEALSAQLGLKSGAGLTVIMVAPGSPAEKAEFRKNDVLAEIDGQMLVLPLQLRKLVQMHAEGEPVKLTFYRGGKKQTTSVKLGKTSWNDAEMDDSSLPNGMRNFQFQLKDLDGQLRGMDGQLRGMDHSLAHAGFDKTKINEEIKRTMEQTRKAIQDAVRHASTDRRSLETVDRELETLARHGVDVDKDTTVTVRHKGNSVRTMVQTDDTGSYIIKAGAKTRLTARDQDGKLLFEGDITTPEEQSKVPKEVWEKVEPMLNETAVPATPATPATPADTAPKAKDKDSE